MSKDKATLGGRAKKHTEVSPVRSSAAAVVKQYLTTAADGNFEKYRIVPDRLFESDFDRMLKALPKNGGTP